MGVIKSLWGIARDLSEEISAQGYKGLKYILKSGEKDEIKLVMGAEGFENPFVREVEEGLGDVGERGGEGKEKFEMLLEEVREDKSLLVKG